MKYIFWNTGRNNDINTILEEMIIEHNCDVLILAEYEDSIDELCNSLFLKGFNYNINANMGGCRVKIILKSLFTISSYTEMEYYTIKKLNTGTLELLLACVHFPSLLRNTDEEITAISKILISDIETIEDSLHHRNTIITGDFNANPFDGSIIKACALHGIPVRNIAKKLARTINFSEYKMFYNPMWNLLGDSREIPGTYYYDSGKQVNFYWNMFDQVIIRPNIIDYFNFNDLRIITSINNKTLISNTGIPHRNISDHLPIIYSLNI